VGKFLKVMICVRLGDGRLLLCAPRSNLHFPNQSRTKITPGYNLMKVALSYRIVQALRAGVKP